MLAIVLPTVWALVALSALGRTGKIRWSAIAALTFTVFLVMVATEALSVASLLSLPWVALFWIGCISAITVLQRKPIRLGWQHLRRLRSVRLDPMDRVTAGVLAFFLTGTLLSAVLYPIVNFDSLTVHMPRVLMWYQNQSVAPHASPHGAQLFSGTVVSYLILQLKILTGGSDRLANLVQWSSYGFVIATTSLIAERLGANRRGQQIVSIATAATAMAALQASTTQDGLTTALWCLVAVAFGLTYVVEPPSTRKRALLWAVMTGAALSLAVQAKASSYIVCAPFYLWFAVVALRRDGVRRLAILTIVILLTMVPLTGGWYARNAVLLDGDVIGSRAPGMAHILVRDTSPSGLATNAIKNTSMLLGTPFAAVNAATESTVRGIVGVYSGRLENPANKETSSGGYRLDGRIATHDVAPSPLTVVLIVISSLIVLAGGRRAASSHAKWYLLASVSAAVVLAGLVSWNLYINRILLAPELLMLPLVGVALTMLQTSGRRLGVSILVAVLTLSVGWGAFVMLFNTTNRLVSPSVLPDSIQARELGYWNTSYEDLQLRILAPEMERSFRLIARQLDQRGIDRVGLYDRVGLTPIYPLLRLLGDRDIGYVGSIVLPETTRPIEFEPQAVIEIIPAEQYPAVLDDGNPRGASLLPAQHIQDWVLLVYQLR